jgi:hypothetical protein
MRPLPILLGKPLSYQALRCIQISTVFFFTLVVQEWLRYPRAGWTGFAVMMIYAGFDNGTTMLRAYHRFLGVFLGLFIGYILWFIGHLDYRSLIFILPMMVFFAYLLAGRVYSIPTTFTVAASVIGTGYFNLVPTASITYFIFDYSLCTFIAFAIILIFEYCWFRHYGMMRRFVVDTQFEVVDDLFNLLHLLQQSKIKRTDWFKSCLKITSSLHEADTLIQNSQFMVRSEQIVGNEFTDFVQLANRIFIHLKALYMVYYTQRYHPINTNDVMAEVQTDMKHLKKIVVYSEKQLEIRLGALHA